MSRQLDPVVDPEGLRALVQRWRAKVTPDWHGAVRLECADELERLIPTPQTPGTKRPWFEASVRIGPSREFSMSIADSADVPQGLFERVYAAINGAPQPHREP